jgi:MFS family permease
MLFEYQYSDKNKKENNGINILGKNANSEEKMINKTEKYKKEIKLKEAFIQAIKGIQIYQLWIMSTILQIVSFTISNTYRSFGEQCLMSEHFLSNLTKAYSILNGLSRLLWGFLFDKFSFKCLYSICISTQAIVDSILYYSVKHPVLFFLLLCFQGIVVSGKISLNVTMFTKVYGINYFGFIYSVSTAIGGFCHLLGPFIIKITVRKIEDYKKLFIGGSLGCILSLIILLSFSEEKFKYKINEDNNEKELKEVLNKT